MLRFTLASVVTVSGLMVLQGCSAPVDADAADGAEEVSSVQQADTAAVKTTVAVVLAGPKVTFTKVKTKPIAPSTGASNGSSVESAEKTAFVDDVKQPEADHDAQKATASNADSDVKHPGNDSDSPKDDVPWLPSKTDQTTKSK